ncbi:MAG TPA: hypothetical protein VF618_09735 [Thermoanaerobaculia bacterium]
MKYGRAVLCLLALMTAVAPMDASEVRSPVIGNLTELPSQQETCPAWMTATQCVQVVAPAPVPFKPNGLRAAPLEGSGPQPCNSTPGLNMCPHSRKKSQPNWHTCVDAAQPVRCDLAYCEYNECFDTNCWQDSRGKCCIDNDWSTTTEGICW